MLRLLLLADIHGNLPALEAVLADARGSFDAVLSAGDQVGLGPWPEEVLSCLQEAGALCVLGNHDQACVSRCLLPADPPGLSLSWTRANLAPERLAALSSLPERREADPWALVHGSLRGPLWEFLLDRPTALASFRLLPGPIGIYGHTHVQGGFILDRGEVTSVPSLPQEVPLRPSARYLLNPGSVGAPRDQDPRAAYALVDLDRHALRFCRVAYPIGVVAKEIDRRGLPSSLAAALWQGR